MIERALYWPVCQVLLSMSKKISAFLITIFVVIPLSGWSQEFVGPEVCKECHSKAYEKWLTTNHAKAKISLSEKQLLDPKCNACHTTARSSIGVQGVICERCHGTGKYYQYSYVMKDSLLREVVGLVKPDEKMCLQCHNEGAPNVNDFHFEERWKKIEH